MQRRGPPRLLGACTFEVGEIVAQQPEEFQPLEKDRIAGMVPGQQMLDMAEFQIQHVVYRFA